MYDPLLAPGNTPDFNTIPWTDTTVNGDTAMGQSYFHENRYVGKAAYLLNF